MGKIIVGYDGREVSDDALALGLRLARAYGDELVVAAAYGFGQDPGDEAEGYFARRAHYFRETFARAAEQVGTFPVTTTAIDDLPGRALFMLSEELGARITVVGSTTRGRIGRTLAGSTGQAILSSALTSAVAVAPRGYARSEHPSIGLVGVGFDAEEDSARAVREAKRLADLMDADLEVISVQPVLSWPVSPVGPEEVSEAELERLLQELAEVDPGGERVELVIDSGDPAEVLARHGVDLDLLVVGSRGFGPIRRALLGSTSSALMRTSPCPVMVVPRGEANPALTAVRVDAEVPEVQS
jgi:nucleotide-binding universal stress UspA family protein